MNDIPKSTISDEFRECWRAGARHIAKIANKQPNTFSWIRADLEQPMIENLAFVLGNQMFFVQIHDVDGKFQIPASVDGLIRLAESWGGHACLMPMYQGMLGMQGGRAISVSLGGYAGDDWKPMTADTRWGLFDARTKRPVDPVAFVTDEKIVMTDAELHHFGVKTVSNWLEGQGKEVLSTCGYLGIEPGIMFLGESGPEYVIVRTVADPATVAPRPAGIESYVAGFKGRNMPVGYFASVVVISAMEDDSGGLGPLYRGGPMYVNFKGLEPLQ